MINPTTGQGASSVALQGLNRAQSQFTNAATDVVNSFGAAANKLNGSKIGQSGVATDVANAAADSPESAMVGMIQAETAVKANLKTLEAESEMQREVMEIVGKRAENHRGRKVDIKA